MARVIKCCCVARWRFNSYSGCLFTLPALVYFPQDAQIGRPYTNHVGMPNLGILYQPTQPCRDAQFGRPIPTHTNHVGMPNLGVLYQPTTHLSPSSLFPPPSGRGVGEGRFRPSSNLPLFSPVRRWLGPRALTIMEARLAQPKEPAGHNHSGELAERSNAAVLKPLTVTGPGVRIPRSPPLTISASDHSSVRPFQRQKSLCRGIHAPGESIMRHRWRNYPPVMG